MFGSVVRSSAAGRPGLQLITSVLTDNCIPIHRAGKRSTAPIIVDC
jgi:hypothetical protein